MDEKKVAASDQRHSEGNQRDQPVETQARVVEVPPPPPVIPPPFEPPCPPRHGGHGKPEQK